MSTKLLPRVTRFRVDAKERVGNRLRVDGHFSRTGTQAYGDQIEYRPPDEVFADTSLVTFRGMPVSIQHPVEGAVTPDNWRRLVTDGVVVGHVGDEIRKAADGVHVSGSVWLDDANAIRRVESGELVELSVGYFAALDETPGVTPAGERYDAVQRNIRGNHLAMLEPGQARGGPTVRMHLDSEGLMVFEAGGDPPKERRTMKITLKIDGVSYTVEVPDDSPLAEAWAKHERSVTALQARADSAAEELAKAKKDEAEAKAALAAATSPEALAALSSARTQLLADAAKVAGGAVEDKGSELDVRRAALVARGVSLDGKDATYVAARFDAALDVANEAPTHDAADQLRVVLDNDSNGKVELSPEQLAMTRL